MEREQAKQIAAETMDILQNGSYRSANGQTVSIQKELQASINNTFLYRPNHVHSLEKRKKEKPVIIECTGETSLEASIRLVDEGYTEVCCLNFASAKNPGGGFLNGSRAQEESLARSSGLYASLLTATEMYEHHRTSRSGFYSDYMVYSPKVPVFRNDDGQLLDKPYFLSFVSSPAVNAGIVREREAHRQKDIEKVMKNRIRQLLSVMQTNGQEALVLGAFGCGVFRNSVHMVARLFQEVLSEEAFAQHFSKIVFAVYERERHQPFLNAFWQTFSR